MTGTCKYCGQTMMIDCQDEEMANVIATEECKCEEGRHFRNIESMKTNAKSNIDTLFEDVKEEAIRVMYQAVDAIAAGEMKSMSIKINERVKATVAKGKDSIKVTRSYSENNTIEAECY